MLSPREHSFLASQRIARLATADAAGAPHAVPVCFAIDGTSLYITIDEKPKRPGAELKRLRNIRENPKVAVIADHYDEDWSQLAWVMLRGVAGILEPASTDATIVAEHARAQSLLIARYPQYARMALADLPVIAMRVGSVTSWGNLARP